MRLSGSPLERLRGLRSLALAGLSDPRVRSVAETLHVPRAALLVVQGLPYRSDPVGTDDWVSPVAETLRCGGDCEDLSAALACLFVAQGYATELVWLTQRGDLDHVTVRVEVQGAWLWAESTVQGARLGEYPYDAARRVGVRVPGLW